MQKREPLFEIRQSSIQGSGAFALRRIRKGRRIVEYKGKRISNEEADELYADPQKDPSHTVLFCVDEHTVIDAAREGNEARLINHSCDPNCEAVLESGRIFIEAIRNIQLGVELSYDYNLKHEGRHTRELKEIHACRCGARNCRGTILAPRPKRRKKGKRGRKTRAE